MFRQPFYFSLIRKYVTLFGTLFNDITITRTNKSGQVTEFIKVPITYAPKEKMLARVTEDPNIDRPISVMTLPVLSFEMTTLSYDVNRKLNTTGRSVVSGADANSVKYQYNPVPYNLGFRLYIYVKNAEDGTKILEQILPYFTPDWTTSVNLIPEMNISHEIPVILTNVSQEDTYEGNFVDRRSLIWILDFNMKAFIYGPIKTGAIIKFANSVFYTPDVADGTLATAVGNTAAVGMVQTQPGLTANGQPTTSANNSIDPNLITATSDFGYVSTITNLPPPQ